MKPRRPRAALGRLAAVGLAVLPSGVGCPADSLVGYPLQVARPSGVRNPGYDHRREELVRRARTLLVALGAKRAGMRDLAAVCGISVPTLRHSWIDRR